MKVIEMIVSEKITEELFFKADEGQEVEIKGFLTKIHFLSDEQLAGYKNGKSLQEIQDDKNVDFVEAELIED